MDNQAEQIYNQLKNHDLQAIYDEEVLEKLVEHLINIQYININYLNEGAFGIVLQAKSLALMRKVAIKIVKITPELEKSMENLQDEISILKQVQFPYILEYLHHESYQLKKKKFMIQVTELCDNSLEDELEILRRNGKLLSDKIKYHIVLKILDAMNFIHSRKIVHRDLKASNILMKDGIPKIGDFGCSTVNNKTLRTMKGTPIFMAPEVFEESYKSPADIYALGLIFLMIENPSFNYESNNKFIIHCASFQQGIIPNQLNFNQDSILYKCAEKMIKSDPEQRMHIQFYIDEVVKFCQSQKIELCKLYSEQADLQISQQSSDPNQQENQNHDIIKIIEQQLLYFFNDIQIFIINILIFDNFHKFL